MTPIYFCGRTALLLCREKTPSLNRDFACARCAHLRYIRQSAGVRTAAALTTKRLALYASKGRRQRNAAPHHRHTGSERLRPLTFQVSRWRRGLVQHPLRRGKGQVRAYRYQDFERTRLSVDRRSLPTFQHVAHDHLASNARSRIPTTRPLRRTQVTALLETRRRRGVGNRARAMNAFEVERPTLHEIAIHEAAHGGDRSLGCSGAIFRSGRRRLKIASAVAS